MNAIDLATKVRADGLRRVVFDKNGEGLFRFSEDRWVVFDQPIDPAWSIGEPSGLYGSLDAAIEGAKSTIRWFAAES